MYVLACIIFAYLVPLSSVMYDMLTYRPADYSHMYNCVSRSISVVVIVFTITTYSTRSIHAYIPTRIWGRGYLGMLAYKAEVILRIFART